MLRKCHLKALRVLSYVGYERDTARILLLNAMLLSAVQLLDACRCQSIYPACWTHSSKPVRTPAAAAQNGTARQTGREIAYRYTGRAARDVSKTHGNRCRAVAATKIAASALSLRSLQRRRGNESVPKIIINDTMSLFFRLQSAFW